MSINISMTAPKVRNIWMESPCPPPCGSHRGQGRPMKLRLGLASCWPFVAASLLFSCRRPFPTAPDREAIVQTQQAFHQALAQGERAAAMDLLAPDAEILEMGARETRAEYAEQHLPADIEFARAVPAARGPIIVRQEGNTAWVSETSTCKGTFRGKAVDTENAELMVLVKTGERWQIRAIHWSSHPHRPSE